MGLTEDVVFLPRVAETDKPALYRAALAFLYPSTYEGFGLPPLEAMASGVPVIAADATSLPEVIGEGGLLLAPGDARAWAEAILTLAAVPRERERLAARGVERARHFHWSMTAALTVAVYRRVLGR
jgi:glycosyltransferase involved in cell wall biosynthesis